MCIEGSLGSWNSAMHSDFHLEICRPNYYGHVNMQAFIVSNFAYAKTAFDAIIFAVLKGLT